MTAGHFIFIPATLLVGIIIGWILGGNVGLGTAAFALLIGPLCGFTLPFFDPVARKQARETREREAVIAAPRP